MLAPNKPSCWPVGTSVGFGFTIYESRMSNHAIQGEPSSSESLEGSQGGKEAKERAGEGRRVGVTALGAPGGSWRRQQGEKGASGGRFAERPPQTSNCSHFLGVRALSSPPQVD